jgi:hypothetical protein
VTEQPQAPEPERVTLVQLRRPADALELPRARLDEIQAGGVRFERSAVE